MLIIICVRVHLSLYSHCKRCLGDCVKEVRQIQILSWTTEYDVRPDASLSDGSCKQFLEDLLGAVRKGLDRVRSSSTSSNSSNPGKAPEPLASSTPQRPVPVFERSKSLDDDMRYEKGYLLAV